MLLGEVEEEIVTARAGAIMKAADAQAINRGAVCRQDTAKGQDNPGSDPDNFKLETASVIGLGNFTMLLDAPQPR